MTAHDRTGRTLTDEEIIRARRHLTARRKAERRAERWTDERRQTLLSLIGMVIVTAILGWMIMLAAGNFDLGQYGYLDVLPVAMIVAITIGLTGISSRP